MRRKFQTQSCWVKALDKAERRHINTFNRWIWRQQGAGDREKEESEVGAGSMWYGGFPRRLVGFKGSEGVPTIRERDAGGWSRIRMAEISGAPAGGQA